PDAPRADARARGQPSRVPGRPGDPGRGAGGGGGRDAVRGGTRRVRAMTIRTQTKSPTTVVSDDSIGDVPWLDPEGAESEGGAAANATGAGTTELLKATGYGFTPPSKDACD